MDLSILSFWFEVALIHIPYTAEFINIKQLIEMALKQFAY